MSNASHIINEDSVDLFDIIDKQFPDTSLEHIVKDSNFKIELPLMYKGNIPIVLKTKSITKEAFFIKVEKEIKINLDIDSSLFFDEESRLYRRKVIVLNDNEISTDESIVKSPKAKYKTCSFII